MHTPGQANSISTSGTLLLRSIAVARAQHNRGFTQCVSVNGSKCQEDYNPSMFESLENTSLAIWVGESIWGYPLMLGLHVIGLSIVVGIFMMLNLRVLGFNRGVSFDAFISLYRLAWTGLLVNALSGFALFSSQATIFIDSTPFLIKLSCIVIGVLLAVLLHREIVSRTPRPDAENAMSQGLARPIAALSILCWLGAICAGRLIAYL
jgi:hypothetical protein